MTTAVLPFAPQPGGFEWLEGEPEFDPARHLQLEMPERVRTLDEFGYTAEEIARTATPVAVTSAFRVLSDEGAVCSDDVDSSRRRGKVTSRLRASGQKAKYRRGSPCRGPPFRGPH